MPSVKLGKRREAVTAAAMLPTYERTQGTLAEATFYEQIEKAGLREVGRDWWPTDGELADTKGQIFRDGTSAVYKIGDALALVSAGHGEAFVRVAAPTKEAALRTMNAFRDLYPATFITTSDDPKVPITFWSLGAMGPERRLRRIDASPWGDIEQNYTASVRDELAAMMHDFEPGKSGQLMLWQGPPGTGKTWALRALASEWAPWAEFHYITDPDAFFVESASYLVEVLLADSYSAIDVTGDIYDEQDEKGKWRVLILEDTGELLSAHAKEKYGQGLSRLLNVVDGMIGQGLRVLVVVTTNDELGELNPAVLRPGRCASQIVFAPLTPEEIAAWGADADDAATIAELYARGKKGQDALVAAFDPDQERDDHGRWVGDGGGSDGADSGDEKAVDSAVSSIAESHGLVTTYAGHGNWSVGTTERQDPSEPPIPAGHLMFASAPGYPSVWQATAQGGGSLGNFTSPAEALGEIARVAP